MQTGWGAIANSMYIKDFFRQNYDICYIIRTFIVSCDDYVMLNMLNLCKIIQNIITNMFVRKSTNNIILMDPIPHPRLS